jgi:hypothetical protein
MATICSPSDMSLEIKQWQRRRVVEDHVSVPEAGMMRVIKKLSELWRTRHGAT